MDAPKWEAMDFWDTVLLIPLICFDKFPEKNSTILLDEIKTPKLSQLILDFIFLFKCAFFVRHKETPKYIRFA